MKSFLLFHLLVLDLAVLSLMVSGEPGVTYYVKPSQSTKCPGQPCETMNYYLKRVNTTINKEKKLTMILLNGNHSLDTPFFKDNLAIKTPIIKMIGESETILKPQGLYSLIYFENNSEVYFKNFVLINLTVVVHSELPLKFISPHVRFKYIRHFYCLGNFYHSIHGVQILLCWCADILVY